MRNFFTIWSRELTACFLSPVAYVTMVIFLVVSGGTFAMEVFRGEGSTDPLPTMLFAAIVVWLTILITVISMSLFTEEKSSGTMETLMTAPVTEVEVVLGKYAGALMFLLIVTAPAVGNIFILNALSSGIDTVDMGAVAGGCLILILVSALCMSVGLLISLLTQHQIIAAVSCFSAIWFVLMFGQLISALPGGWDELEGYLLTLRHIEVFSLGIVDTRPIVLYFSCTTFLLFAAVRVLESRRWS